MTFFFFFSSHINIGFATVCFLKSLGDKIMTDKGGIYEKHET